jgi:protein-S-isoprenylcysteine O-methyltransferase Ste14
LIAGLATLFASAGTLNWANGWIYAFLVSSYWVISTGVLAKVNPAVLNERGSLVKKGTKAFDVVWVIVYPLLTFSNLVLMGFDAVRFRWSDMPTGFTLLGVILFVSASPFSTWAMAVNRFFEWTVRIQRDKQQYVCSAGPISDCEASRVC